LLAVLLIFIVGLVCKILKRNDGRRASMEINERLIGLKPNEDEEKEQGTTWTGLL
jgi:hypothetical protein